MKALFPVALWALLYALVSVPGVEGAPVSSVDLETAEREFWQAAERSGHVGLISAYLLHFANGRFAPEAIRLFRQETGQAWSSQTAAQAAWLDPTGDDISEPRDAALAGRWVHSALCDINAWTMDIPIESRQTFHLSGSGLLTGDSIFHHGKDFCGRGDILELRRTGTLLTYVMRAENNLTGAEVHVGVLNLRNERGALRTRGWEMNTAGTYCDVAGGKNP